MFRQYSRILVFVRFDDIMMNSVKFLCFELVEMNIKKLNKRYLILEVSDFFENFYAIYVRNHFYWTRKSYIIDRNLFISCNSMDLTDPLTDSSMNISRNDQRNYLEEHS